MSAEKSLGPLSGGAQATNSFDLNVLETKDFYNGLLKNMSADALEFWFEQGLPRPLVFYALLDSIRVTYPNGDVYEFRNDPADDQWTDAPGDLPEYHSARCEPGRGGYLPELRSHSFWVGTHARDCRFAKFRYLGHSGRQVRPSRGEPPGPQSQMDQVEHDRAEDDRSGTDVL